METSKSVFKDYELITIKGAPFTLGFGAYGTVQMGRCRKTKKTVALKRINGKLAFNEVQFHYKLNHPNIIKMYDFYFDEKNQTTHIVLEYAENGTLFEFIRDKGARNKTQLKEIFKSVCEAIDYMHSKGIMHRDIKPENMLLDRNNNVKICDFGYAANCQRRMTMCGTVEYMAPEMILRRPYTYKIDNWGLGILLFELIQGHAPFQANTHDEVISKMTKPIYFSKKFTKDQMELVHRILKVNPAERPEISQILKSPCLYSHQPSKEISKRSTMEEDKDMGKKIQILEVKNFSTEQKTIKRSSGTIQITSIRDLTTLGDQTVNYSLLYPPKTQKISLRKNARRS